MEKEIKSDVIHDDVKFSIVIKSKEKIELRELPPPVVYVKCSN